MKPLRTLTGLALTAGLGLGLYAWAGERPRMNLHTYRIWWPPAAGLRILHLSDQHFGADHWVQRRRMKHTRSLLASLRPDVIFLTGDFLHDDQGLAATERMLQALPPAPLGVYAVLGNHDYALYSYGELFRNMAEQVKAAASPSHKLSTLRQEAGKLGRLAWNIYRNERLRFAVTPNNTAELRHLLQSYGVTLLDNQARPLRNWKQLWIAGVDDLVEGETNLSQALNAIPEDAHIILLTHHPDVAFSPAAQRAQLVFSGHTHGGQVVLPRLGAIHTQGSRLSRQQPAGLIPLPNGGQMIVSRGMGESTPLRFRCPPEIVWAEII